jgi:hypothetical protein
MAGSAQWCIGLSMPCAIHLRPNQDALRQPTYASHCTTVGVKSQRNCKKQRDLRAIIDVSNSKRCKLLKVYGVDVLVGSICATHEDIERDEVMKVVLVRLTRLFFLRFCVLRNLWNNVVIICSLATSPI